MTNSTQQYIQTKLEFAQEDVKPYGIDLGIKGVNYNTVRVVGRGVKIIKDSAVGSRRSRQQKDGIPVAQQEYLYPLKDSDGNVVKDSDGKDVKILLQYGVIKQVNPAHAESIRVRLANQAEGMLYKVREMEEA